jgi:diguanylate cyclase (GGDEF)-like protein/putative nucleotidyltransferase with HDIG domain
MGALHNLLPSNFSVIFFLLLLPSAVFIIGGIRRYRLLSQKNSLLYWFSDPHAPSKELNADSDPRQMMDATLDTALRAFCTTDGCIVLEQDASEGSSLTTTRGFSASSAKMLTAEPIRSYLASSAERWGALMVFPDLDSQSVAVLCQRDSQFHEFINAMKADGFRSLMIIGLGARGKSFGTLLTGRRAGRPFAGEELHLAMAISNHLSTALENWSLIRASERHDQELQILYAVGRAMRETFDVEAQIQILRHGTKDLLGEVDFSLSMQNSAEGPLETVVPFPFEGAGDSDDLANSLDAEVIRTRLPRLIAEDWQWARHAPAFPRGDTRIRTWCGVPFHFSDGSMGVLAAASPKREKAIRADQFELIKALAVEAAGAFENSRAFQREQRRSAHLALLSEIGQKATSVLNPKELLPKICNQIQKAFEYDLARIDVMERLGDELVVEAEAGYGSELLGRRIRLGVGMAGAAAEKGEPVLTNTAKERGQFVALAEGVKSSLSLPLKYQDGLLGVLTLESRREYSFAPQDVLTLKTLADQLAIALHNARAYQCVLEEAITDGLTGLKTHRYFMEALEREWRRSSRAGRPFALIMMDLDNFKPVNDRHGHLQGDRVLSTVAKVLGDGVRQSSVMARYGGDEFAILMSDSTSDQATVLAERLRANIERDSFLSTHGVTASFGIGAFPENGPTHEEILHAADTGMYLAKHEAGNRIRVATSIPDRGQVAACLGVEFKRRFSTGPEAFNAILNRIETAIESDGQVPLVDTVTSLARAIDLSDHYTRDHSEAVARLAVQIARQLGMSETQVEEIRLAGILHDIGKMGIPDAILYKPARLTTEEFVIMQSHAVKGQRILEPLKVDTIQRISLFIRSHHERFDGTGYPDRLKGEGIPLGARILTVADCFDTMISERAYKEALTLGEAVAELLRCSGTQFDPELVKSFLSSLDTLGDPRGHASSGEPVLVRRNLV